MQADGQAAGQGDGLRALIGASGTKIGTFLFEFATPGIGQILKAAGADFAVLDMEHTGFGFETVRQVVRYCQAASLPLVVRVPSQQRHHISRALDAGADGVMVPIVSSVEQAKAVLEAAKYWPDGTRGVALGLAHERYAMRSEPLVPRLAEQNRRTAIILQIEDPQGAAAASDIAALPGVDMLWLGHNDLSAALGAPGAFEAAEFVSAETRTIAAAKAHGKSVGRLAVDARQGAAFRDLGYDFVAIAGDVWLLQQAFASGVAAIRRG
jgi:2-dehydro-3-deoxyglucarate aldolase/4-hydroxy-2-oxoheptanedioate aldolase